MNKKKISKTIKWILVGVGLTVLTSLTVIFVFLYLFLFGPPATKTTNISNYHEIFEHTNGLRTAYIVFPEEIPEGVIDSDFYYYYRDTFGSATYEVYLQCKYDEDTYAKEVIRLKNTSKTYGGTKVYLKYEETPQYPYPAFIANENAGCNYEYAMLTGNNEITYICTAFQDIADINFDSKYLPRDFMSDDGRDFGSGFSIYYASVSSGVIDTKYTRDPVEEVIDGHIRLIGDHMFCVNTRLDEQNREIISRCIFSYITNPMQEGKDTEYHELDGYEYVDLELNEERNHAIVTYMDEKVEKQWDVELPLQRE